MRGTKALIVVVVTLTTITGSRSFGQVRIGQIPDAPSWYNGVQSSSSTPKIELPDYSGISSLIDYGVSTFIAFKNGAILEELTNQERQRIPIGQTRFFTVWRYPSGIVQGITPNDADVLHLPIVQPDALEIPITNNGEASPCVTRRCIRQQTSSEEIPITPLLPLLVPGHRNSEWASIGSVTSNRSSAGATLREKAIEEFQSRLLRERAAKESLRTIEERRFSAAGSIPHSDFSSLLRDQDVEIGWDPSESRTYSSDSSDFSIESEIKNW